MLKKVKKLTPWSLLTLGSLALAASFMAQPSAKASSTKVLVDHKGTLICVDDNSSHLAHGDTFVDFCE